MTHRIASAQSLRLATVSRFLGLLACLVSLVSPSAATTPPANASQHWAFQSPRPTAPPTTLDPFPHSAPARNPIDLFIRAALRNKGLRPASPASRSTLIRRVAIDLTGLPPTRDEVKAFVADPDPNALDRWIDHYLASPRYGERWGRHWLDIARFADSNGQDENKAMANAWRYRDYVIRSFNQDKPFDRFILEQIAGDLLPSDFNESQRFENLIATGFLVIGPKMLAEQDKPKLVMDVVDEQIDTLGRAFLGLTLSCARCHDHKFDPLPTEDYYAIAGILKSTKSMKNLDFVSQWNEVSITPAEQQIALRAHEAKTAALEKQLKARIVEANHAVTNASRSALPKDPRPLYPKAVLDQILELEQAQRTLAENAPPPASIAMAVSEDPVVDLPIHIRGSHLTLAPTPTQRGLPKVLARANAPTLPATQSGRLQLAQWFASSENPLTARVIVNRIWQGHFGTGLVKTADNFGLKGDRPSHPELLDWLALEFIRSGWSLKQLHRLILSSATYQQSGPSASLAPSTADPDNRLLSFYPRQRFEAEMVRDSMLAVSGSLDLSMGGTLVGWKNNEYVPGEEVAFQSKRRSVYLPIIRDRVHDVLTIFDFANPSIGVSQRASTIVSHQALFHMNSAFAIESATLLARRLLKLHPDRVDNQLLEAYTLVFARPPTEQERARCLSFLQKAVALNPPSLQSSSVQSVPEPALAALCQVLLGSNEFNHRE